MKHIHVFSVLCFVLLTSIVATAQQQWSGSTTTANPIWRQGIVEMNAGIRGGTVVNNEFPMYVGYTQWDGGAISLYTHQHPNGGGIESVAQKV